MTAGRLLPASVAGQQTQIFHISTGTRRNNNCGYLSFANTLPRITVRRGSRQGPYLNDKTPTPETKKLEREILATFSVLPRPRTSAK